MGRKTDRRIQRTRKALFDAFMALLLEKEYEAITVTEIADQANVGRATFYLHYRDKDDLLASNIEALFEEVAGRIRPLLKQSILARDTIQGRILFEEAARNKDLYLLVFRQGGTLLYDRLQRHMADLIAETLETLIMGGDSPIEISLLASYLTGALTALVKWWLENDMPCSADYMAAVAQHLIRPGMEQVALLESDWYTQKE
ncbi:MAG: TetR/AcrR family transcriptional regulator [Chloroflexi bacterium]|nr:MAG: TetR/AcrR family transcriptional regulator [Chloroflexota bacterium]